MRIMTELKDYINKEISCIWNSGFQYMYEIEREEHLLFERIKKELIIQGIKIEDISPQDLFYDLTLCG